MAEPAFHSAHRAAVTHALADPDGIRIVTLLIARLRFERLIVGSGRADPWFERDTAEFAAAFRTYCADVPPTAFLPADESNLFERWFARS